MPAAFRRWGTAQRGSISIPDGVMTNALLRTVLPPGYGVLRTLVGHHKGQVCDLGQYPLRRGSTPCRKVVDKTSQSFGVAATPSVVVDQLSDGLPARPSDSPPHVPFRPTLRGGAERDLFGGSSPPGIMPPDSPVCRPSCFRVRGNAWVARAHRASISNPSKANWRSNRRENAHADAGPLIRCRR